MVLESSTIRYVQHQIARMDGGFDRGNCLYRIASGADLLTGNEPMDELYYIDQEAWVKQHVQVDLDQWIAEFRRQYGGAALITVQSSN